jgi:hypothetical protein
MNPLFYFLPCRVFSFNYFDLFLLRQVWLSRMIAFWAAPIMTIVHFFFTAISTCMLTAIRFDERDLITIFAEKYTRAYVDPIHKSKEIIYGFHGAASLSL